MGLSSPARRPIGITLALRARRDPSSTPTSAIRQNYSSLVLFGCPSIDNSSEHFKMKRHVTHNQEHAAVAHEDPKCCQLNDYMYPPHRNVDHLVLRATVRVNTIYRTKWC